MMSDLCLGDTLFCYRQRSGLTDERQTGFNYLFMSILHTVEGVLAVGKLGSWIMPTMRSRIV